ncbi:hypothetical protein AQUCO_04200164v1 [Aquilegia coerulea]|uniref:Chloride channel protein n=2 Tax=Aquilegia coerulea TaxID=218851 RepID=A0A2G5CPQ5_AQUCA|nr:hypothetical protein AQUCO_04200164v1 [Aquilegia coerulea]PIA33220.1 hypothetical protein AQUCO_04200164v1 [Aquilegia coerulea]PIA33221.1 hypothetical protein AQUCO_04200164v1 [Aquilegia coerulea]
MDLCSCICYFPNSFCSTSKISSSFLGSFYCKSSFPRLNTEERTNRFSSYYFTHPHGKSLIHSRRQDVDKFKTRKDYKKEEGEESEKGKLGGVGKLIGLVIPIPGQEKENNEENLGVLAACILGLFTGIGVVLFNNAVHEIRYIFWDGIPSRGASWLRQEPIQDTWKQVIFVPVFGGIIVSMLNTLRASLESDSSFPLGVPVSNAKAAFRSLLKTIAASVTLGTGNSLGPEGPSVEIGASIAKGISSFFARGVETRLSLIAAGSAAGFSSGFNAAVAGCFFAVESVLRPSSAESSPSLTNTTSIVILSAVIAAVVSQVGLGSEPAFKVPEYDFRSPTELPLYLLLGILCGLVSLTFSRCTSYALTAVDTAQKDLGIPKPLFPVLGGLSVGLIALAYPEILYWGFVNVDLLLESRPSVDGLSADLLLQLVGVKILVTSLCRASGLVGGYYAPSLFIGAATGMAYGKFISYAISVSDPTFHFSFLEVASPQAYGLVGMAATLAGVCQVPLTAVLLLFELTQDYRIVLPLLGAVGLSSLIASGQTRDKDVGDKTVSFGSKNDGTDEPQKSFLFPSVLSHSSALAEETSDLSDLCELESSLCVDDSFKELKILEERVLVSQAMRTRYATVLMSTLLTEAVALMLAEKQYCALIVDNNNLLVDFVTLGDIQEFCEFNRARTSPAKVKTPLISEIYHVNNENGRKLWTATSDMDLLSARRIMDKHGLEHLPVVIEHVKGQCGHPVGLLDRECINLTCRAIATQDFLTLFTKLQRKGLK